MSAQRLDLRTPDAPERSGPVEAPLVLTTEPPRPLGFVDQLAMWGNLGISLFGPLTGALVATTRAPVSGPKRLMPRLPHMASWSTKRNGLGGSVVRTRGASVRAGAEVRFATAGEEEEETDIERHSLRRHYPVRFGRSADPRTHSALSAHHWGVSSRRLILPPR